ncbi:MAG TPA: hypothetical protein VF278_21475 [Pirellulales bacterium]
MASPFAIFRKNQKTMYALLAVMCMIGFSIGGFLSDGDSMSGPQDPVVATAYGKSVRAREVQQLLRRRRLTVSFLAECKAAEFNLPAAAQFLAPQFEQMFGPATEEAVVETWLLTERARQMGMVISDGAINRFLKDLTDDKVKAAVFTDVAKQLDIGQPQLFEALRGELMALRLREMALGRLQTTPAQRWDYYRREKQRATLEVAVLPVEDFISEVPDATKEELLAFFDTHKEQEPNPESPIPGFKVPKTADFQVVIAQFADYYDEKAVTEAEIKKHYDEFKETRYLWEQYDFDDPTVDVSESPAADGEKPADQKPADQKPADEKATDTKPADTKPVDEKKVDETKAADGKPEKQPAAKPADDKAKTPPAKADKKSQSSTTFDRDVKIVGRAAGPSSAPGGPAGRPTVGLSLAQAVTQPTALVAGLLADEPAAEKKADASAKQQDSGDKKTTEKPVAGDDVKKKDAAKPADQKKDGAAKTTGKSPAAKTNADKSKAAKAPKLPPLVGDELVLPRDIRKGTHPKHAPLWRVENAIRKEVAREKANQKVEAALTVVRDKMRKYARRMATDESEEKMPGLDKLAKENGLTSNETGMLTARELNDKFPDLAQARGEQGGAAFLQFAYTTMAKFQSTTVQDIESNRYLVWKVQEKDAFVPDFADVQSKVLRVWKLIKARDISLQKAKDLSAEANKAGKSLTELFGDRKGLTVRKPPPFSWLTRGSANVDNRAPLQTSEVEGVDSAGPDFMREVFGLAVGSCGEAMNQPKTVAYVVRLTNLNPSSERLRTSFLADPFQLYNEVAREDFFELQRAWMKGIETEAKLTWKEKPSQEVVD